MIEGKGFVAWYGVTFAKKGDLFGDKIVPFHCKNCGYIEFYKEMKS